MDGDDLSNYFKGTYGVQERIDIDDEAVFKMRKETCERNCSHLSFVPVKKFSINDVRHVNCHEDLVKFIKYVADLTVRIAVNFTSADRPEVIGGTKDEYPGYKYRGKNTLRAGTGNVCDVKKHSGGLNGCPCPECELSDTPSKVWWEICVKTSKHVVFDSSEARQSSCRLWFDDDQSPVDKIHGGKVTDSDSVEESCLLTFATHNPKIGERLFYQFNAPDGYLRAKYEEGDFDNLTIIISHPHGCSKQVSVGYWVHEQVVEGETARARYTYTTATCHGSCGAQVYIPGSQMSSLCTHMGYNKHGLSYSGFCKHNDNKHNDNDTIDKIIKRRLMSAYT